MNNEAALPPSPFGRGRLAWSGSDVVSLPDRPNAGEGVRQKLALPPETLAFARSLRSNQTTAESLLWTLLRNRRFFGLKFRRQHSVPPYVLDFYCDSLSLAIELDGGQHNDDVAVSRDQRRSQWLADRGITVIRYWNNDVLQHPESVLEDLMLKLESDLCPSPDAVASTSPEGRGKLGGRA